jgi:hypothetical protein
LFVVIEPMPTGLVTFYVARDSLGAATFAEAAPAVLFNAILANSGGRAAHLALPATQVELAGRIDTGKLRRLAVEVSRS